MDSTEQANNLMCRCNHVKSMHDMWNWRGELRNVCWYRDMKKECSCINFKLDNLKYLEYKYEQKATRQL